MRRETFVSNPAPPDTDLPQDDLAAVERLKAAFDTMKAEIGKDLSIRSR